MLRDVQIPLFPTVTNCLAWSDDGELAVATGEYVHILVPNRRKRSGIHQTSEPWIHVHLRVNLFTFQEWPLQNPISIADFSIGEEQSLSTVINIAWSPPGPAKYRRSALAVLTSNLVLSIWAPGCHPSMTSSWKRLMLLSGCLENYFSKLGFVGSTLRKRRRIRCMSWASNVPDDVKQNYGVGNILAVINDFEDIVIINVKTAHNYQDHSWQAKVLCHHENDDTSLVQREFGYEIVWGRWVSTENAIEATVSCKIRSSYITMKFKMTDYEESDRPKDFIADRNSDRPLPDLVLTLDHIAAAVSPQRLMLGNARQFLSSRPWDVVSGLCRTEDYCYIVTHLSQIETFHIQSNHDTSGSEVDHLSSCKKESMLQLRMSECRRRYANDHRLGEMTTIKTWGISSFGQYVASCITLHPSDRVEYNVPSLERSFIIFSHVSAEDGTESQTGDADLYFPWETPPRLKELSIVHGEIWSNIYRRLEACTIHTSLLSYRILYASYCASLMWQGFDRKRLEQVKSALRPFSLSDKEMCLEHEVKADKTFVAEPSDGQQSAEAVNAIVQHRSEAEFDTPSAQCLLEYCQIPECSKPLFWTSNLYRARCNAGHLWNRCALTFVAIQEPGISKFCDTCGREYLNEDTALEQDTINSVISSSRSDRTGNAADESAKPSRKPIGPGIADNESLAQALFRAHDVCIYCGGKFIG